MKKIKMILHNRLLYQFMKNKIISNRFGWSLSVELQFQEHTVYFWWLYWSAGGLCFWALLEI